MDVNRTPDKPFFDDTKKRIALAGSAAAVVGVMSYSQPAKADVITDLTGMVDNLGTITTAAVGVIVTAMTVRLAVKTVNRLMVKG